MWEVYDSILSGLKQIWRVISNMSQPIKEKKNTFPILANAGISGQDVGRDPEQYIEQCVASYYLSFWVV